MAVGDRHEERGKRGLLPLWSRQNSNHLWWFLTGNEEKERERRRRSSHQCQGVFVATLIKKKKKKRLLPLVVHRESIPPSVEFLGSNTRRKEDVDGECLGEL